MQQPQRLEHPGRPVPSPPERKTLTPAGSAEIRQFFSTYMSSN